MATGVAAVCCPQAMATISSLHSSGFGSNNSKQTLRGSSIVPARVLCVATARKTNGEGNEGGQEVRPGISRRDAIKFCGLAATFPLLTLGDRMTANGGGLPDEDKPRLCDATCEKELENIPTQTTPSGLQYKDIVLGKGPSPPKGFQVAANYVAMIPTGKVFDSSLEKGLPYIFRVGSGQVIKGLDEGISSMKVGGKRRLYIPGELAFPKGLSAAAGRPRVAPSSPVVFDVNLLYIPGLENELPDEEESPAVSSSEIPSDDSSDLVDVEEDTKAAESL